LKPVIRKFYRGAKDLARETGFSPQLVSQKFHQGWSPEQIRQYAVQQGRMSKEAYEASKKAAKKEQREEPKPSKKDEKQEADPEIAAAVAAHEESKGLAAAKRRREVAQAEKIEMENAVRRGDLVPTGQIVPSLMRCHAAFRDALLAIPGELADRLAMETDPAVVRKLLDDRHRQALRHFETLRDIWEAPLANAVA